MHGFGLYALALATPPAGPTGEPGDITGSDVAAEATDSGELALALGVGGSDTASEATDSGFLALALSIAGTDTAAEATDSGALALGPAEQTLRIRTFFASTTWTPTTSGDTALECWGGGGGGTTNVSGGSGGAYARDDVFARTASVGITITIGAAGAAGGGTGGDTSIGSTCIAKGAVGNTPGQASASTGDVKRTGGQGVANPGGSSNGGGSPGSGSDASGATPGDPDGALGAGANSVNAAKRPAAGGRSSSTGQFPGAAGLARATYYVPADPTLPVIVGATHQRSSGTTHPVTIPAGLAGDTIYYFIFTDGAPTIGLSGGSGTSVLSQANGTACKLEVLSHAASGAPTDVTTSANESVQIFVVRMRHVASVSGTAATASVANADPPSHDMGSSAATLWFTGIVIDATTNTGDVTGDAPSGFTDSYYGPCPSSAGVVFMLAWMSETAQTKDPGAFSNQSSDSATFTMGFRR